VTVNEMPEATETPTESTEAVTETTATTESTATTATATPATADEVRARRKVREGTVVSNKMDKTAVVAVTALTAVAAQIAIPLPFTPVPLSGQTFAVLLSVAALGPARRPRRQHRHQPPHRRVDALPPGPGRGGAPHWCPGRGPWVRSCALRSCALSPSLAGPCVRPLVGTHRAAIRDAQPGDRPSRWGCGWVGSPV